MERVTRPDKIVTDRLVLKRLVEQDIDPNYVEFYQDYAKRGVGKNPYMKGYRDLKSGKQFMVVSGLPMVDAYGFKHELVWREKNGILENGNNIFHCVIEKGTVRLVVLSDQPYGIKKDTECSYHAQLFINGSEILPSYPVPLILATDPINPNYHDNVVLWQYDTICRRRIRIIEGRFRERWFIDKHPNGRVRIKHNLVGNLKLKFGSAQDAEYKLLKVTVIDNEEIIEASEFDDVVFPVEIGASLTVYPDIETGNTTVDGTTQLERLIATTQWAAMRIGDGDGHNDEGAELWCAMIEQHAETSPLTYRYIVRGHFLFDTSALTDDVIISVATFSLYGSAVHDQFGNWNPEYGIVSTNPLSNNDLINGDHDTPGATRYSDTDIAEATFIDDGYNDQALNAIGLAAISKTGITKIGVRIDDDLDNTEPADGGAGTPAQGFIVYYADQGEGFKPKLVVTYTLRPVPVADGDLIGIGIIRKS